MPTGTSANAISHADSAELGAMPPLGSAVVLAGGFMALLAAGPSLAFVATFVGALFVVQIVLQARLAMLIEAGTAGVGPVRSIIRFVAPLRHAAMLFAVCMIAATTGHAVLAVLVSLALFAAVLTGELVAVTVLSALAGVPAFAALHVTEGTFGLAGETV